MALIKRCLSWGGIDVPRAVPRSSLGAISELRPRSSHSHSTPELARSCFFPRTCQTVLLHSLQCRRPSRQRYRVVLMVAGIIQRLFQPCLGSFSPFGFASTATFDLKVVELLLVSCTVSPPWPTAHLCLADAHHPTRKGRGPGRGVELESRSPI